MLIAFKHGQAEDVHNRVADSQLRVGSVASARALGRRCRASRSCKGLRAAGQPAEHKRGRRGDVDGVVQGCVGTGQVAVAGIGVGAIFCDRATVGEEVRASFSAEAALVAIRTRLPTRGHATRAAIRGHRRARKKGERPFDEVDHR